MGNNAPNHSRSAVSGLLAAALPAGSARSRRPFPRRPHPDPVLVGAGDIASCTEDGDEQTAALLDQIDGTIFTLGDNVYPNGTPNSSRTCYDPTLGTAQGADAARPRATTTTAPPAPPATSATSAAPPEIPPPATTATTSGPGTSSSSTATARTSAAAAPAPAGEVARAKTSPRTRRPAPSRCGITRGTPPRARRRLGHAAPLEGALRRRAEVALSGHDHIYERFAPQDADGTADTARGIRQFVVGTGGKDLYRSRDPTPTARSATMQPSAS